MISFVIRKLLVMIANMSKKASKIYCITLTFFFIMAVCLLLSGLILINPDKEYPSFAIGLTIAGAVFLFAVVFTIMLTTIASNYVKRRPELSNKDSLTKKDDSKKNQFLLIILISQLTNQNASYADVVELVDTWDLGSNASAVSNRQKARSHRHFGDR